MDFQIFQGFLYVLLGACCAGTFAFPAKFSRILGWETLWLGSFFFAMIVVPIIMARILIPNVDVIEIFRLAGWRPVLWAMIFGALWGIGCVTFSIGVPVVGISLGYALVMGVNTAVGSFIPLLTDDSTDFTSSAFMVTCLGVGVCLLGVAISGYAGVLREREAPAAMKTLSKETARLHLTTRQGMLICVLCGTVSAGVSLGFHFGADITKCASQYISQPTLATLPIWFPIFFGGAVVVHTVYGIVLVRRKTYREYFRPGAWRELLLFGGGMGLLQYGANVLAGFGMERLSVSVGWAAKMCTTIIVANVLGLISSEWKDASKRSLKAMWLGLIFLLLSMFVLGYAKSLSI